MASKKQHDMNPVELIEDTIDLIKQNIKTADAHVKQLETDLSNGSAHLETLHDDLSKYESALSRLSSEE